MLSTILIVILVLILLGGFYPYGSAPQRPYHGYGFGWPGGLVGLVLIVLLVLLLAGRL